VANPFTDAAGNSGRYPRSNLTLGCVTCFRSLDIITIITLDIPATLLPIIPAVFAVQFGIRTRVSRSSAKRWSDDNIAVPGTVRPPYLFPVCRLFRPCRHGRSYLLYVVIHQRRLPTIIDAANHRRLRYVRIYTTHVVFERKSARVPLLVNAAVEKLRARRATGRNVQSQHPWQFELFARVCVCVYTRAVYASRSESQRAA